MKINMKIEREINITIERSFNTIDINQLCCIVELYLKNKLNHFSFSHGIASLFHGNSDIPLIEIMNIKMSN